MTWKTGYRNLRQEGLRENYILMYCGLFTTQTSQHKMLPAQQSAQTGGFLSGKLLSKTQDLSPSPFGNEFKKKTCG